MAGHKTWVLGEEVLASDFTSFVSDQIVAVYASAAARTAGWPTPPTGAVSVLLDHPGAFYTYNGSAWVLAGAGGEVGDYRQATDVGIPGSLSYMGFGIDVPVVSGRIYRVDFYYQVSHIAVSTVNVQLRQGAAASGGSHSTILQRSTTTNRPAGAFESYFLTGRYVAAATATTGISVWASTSNTATIVQGGNAFTELRVFDVGTT